MNPYQVNPNPRRQQLPPATGIQQRTESLTVSDVRFALDFYRALAEGEGNVLFSPLSLSTVIGALTEGARGATADELLRALNRTVADVPSNLQRTRHLMAQLDQPSSHQALSVASRLYLQRGFQVNPEFLRALIAYGMEATPADFLRPQDVERDVNEWVSRSTRGHIASLVPPGTFDAQTRLVLANAVYFKGDWDTTFPPENTRLRPFSHRRTKTVQVPTMMVQGDFPYGDFTNYGFEMLELPYAGRNVSMVVLLPYPGKSLTALARRLAQRPNLVANPGRRLAVQSTTVFLPKFRLEMSVDAKATLSRLGVRLAFQQGLADLSGIATEGQLFVSDALHKAAIEVTERGTRASAASAVVIKGRSMSSDPVFRATRPFLFFLRHNPTAAVLFMGHVKHFKDASPLARADI